jgi:PAS domain S-box-containing protein
MKEELDIQGPKSTTELKFVNERLQLELGARQRAEAALRESEERYRQLVEFSPEGIIIHDQAGQILFSNAAGAIILGAAHSDQIVGKMITDLVHRDYQTASAAQIQQAGETQVDTPPLEQRFTRFDGTEIDVEIEIIPFELQAKPAIQLVFRDITERKKTEAEIKQRSRELTILQSAGAAITSKLDLRYVLDTFVLEMARLLQVENCTISEWNQEDNTITKIAGYGSEGWWDPKAVVEPYDLAVHPLVRSVLEDQIPEQMTISQPNVDPSEFAYMSAADLKTVLMLPMIFQRYVLGLIRLEDSQTERVFTYQEISTAKLLAGQAANAIKNAQLFEQARQEIEERQKAEAALEEERAMLTERVKERTVELRRANAELARASKLKDEFLASMSHELRTPLNAILGSSEILQAQAFGPLNEKQLRYAHNVEESGRHLLSLINDILDLSKVEAGKLELEIRPVSIESVCQTSLRLVKQLAHKKQLKLTSKFDQTVTTLQADERRLKQILVNLLSNAIKFTPEGGQVGLEVQGTPDDDIVRFVVWDTGVGIEQESISRLFQPFVQLDSSLSRQQVGTGLGLSLVSRMTEAHGGGVAVESEVGVGSRFTVSFPGTGPLGPVDSTEEMKAEAAEERPAATLKQKVTAGEQPLILLADDNEDNISMILEFLQGQGYRVVVAQNGSEAIELAKEEKPNVILMDIQMPVMDGLEATRRLKADANLAGIPIIALTALAMTGDRERCLAAGASEYMSKPVSPVKLVEVISTFLN